MTAMGPTRLRSVAPTSDTTTTAAVGSALDEAAVAVLRGLDDRGRLVLLLRMYAGLRFNELVTLRGTDVDEEHLRVRGRTERQVRLHEHLRVALRAELRRRRAGEASGSGWGKVQLDPDGWLFPSSHGEHLSRTWASRTVDAALPAGWTTYDLRDRLEDLRDVQELLLGYTSLTGVTVLHAAREPQWSDWTEWITGWSRYMRAAGKAPGTVKIRTYHVMRMASDLGVERPGDVTALQLLEWLGSNTWAPGTRRAYRVSARLFYAWAVLEDRLSRSPAEALPTVAVPRGRPRPAPEEAYAAALATAPARIRRAVRLGGDCGLRPGEVARTRREDIEGGGEQGWWLRVVGKGGHVRTVPLPDDLAAELLALPGGWLFPSSHGGHLTVGHLAGLVRRALGEQKGVTAHTLRHRCGTVAYRETRDLRAVQELLGHSRPETTALYTKVADDDVRTAMLAAATRRVSF